jgi:hypothetical protein
VTVFDYYVDALASSCEIPLYADYFLYASPACGSAGLIGGDVNGGWYGYTVMLKSGYVMEPIDLAGLAVNVGVENLRQNSYGNLICGGPDSNCAVVPEPMSIFLLATGLFALGFAELRRRRRLREV